MCANPNARWGGDVADVVERNREYEEHQVTQRKLAKRDHGFRLIEELVSNWSADAPISTEATLDAITCALKVYGTDKEA